MMPKVCVFAPSPLLTVTIEPQPDDVDIHFHPGGQGFWIGRMIAGLGADVVLCTSFGGEAGRVTRGLVSDPAITVRAIETSGSNGAYVHDRRSGKRVAVAEMPPDPLTRHEVDELYGATLVEGLDAGVCVLGGSADPQVVPSDVYRRLAEDLTRNGAVAIADLSREQLSRALVGRISVLKVSDEELEAEGRAERADLDSVVAAVHKLEAEGARNVVVSRAERPIIALLDGELLAVRAPQLDVVDHRGAGDSVTAGIAAGVTRGLPLRDAVCLGAAAGAINVARHGLATGTREEIERMSARVDCTPLDEVSAQRCGT